MSVGAPLGVDILSKLLLSEARGSHNIIYGNLHASFDNIFSSQLPFVLV